MLIAHRGGHSPNCKGAMGILDEQLECIKISRQLGKVLNGHGVKAIDCSSTDGTVIGDMAYGVNKANGANANYYIPIHMNASASHQGTGVECWIHTSNNYEMRKIAERICNNLSKALGIPNRGVKMKSGFYDLKNTEMPACIVECLFCDNNKDATAYYNVGYEKIAQLIANGIVPSIPTEVSESGNYTDPIKPQVNVISKLQAELNTQGFKDMYGNKLVVDGIMGPKTLSACPIIKKGAKGNITKILQGMVGTTADGDFGPNTHAHVRQYQINNGLQADGIVGPKTWQKLLSIY